MSRKDQQNPRNLVALCKELSRFANNHVTDMSLFGALDSNSERVDFALNLLNSSKISAEFLSDGKNEEVAVQLREKGNEMFKTKKLKEAWEFYSKSICLSAENSVNLGLAYANRSAVLFEMNLQKECVEDINRALEHNYPEHLKQKLQVREKNSKNIEHVDTRKPYEVLPIIKNKNSKIECASNCVKIRENEKFGRYVVATRNIKAGEILGIEKSFASLLVDQYFSHCHECINLCYNLIPCKRCTCAMYCSEACRDRAFETYHKYECPILATLRFLNLDKLKMLTLKIAFLVKDKYSEDLTTSAKEIFRTENYKEVHNLVTNTSKRSINDLFGRASAVAIIFNLVKDHTDFLSDSNPKLEEFFKEVLLLHMQTGPSNFHEITELVANPSGIYELEEIASGVFPFVSMLNHSCCPNATRFSYGSTVVLRAVQNIRKGEQCFDNYGYHHALMDRKERQKYLGQYHFRCVCEACEHNWPKYDALPEVGGVAVDESLWSKLSSADVETAEEILDEFLTKLGNLQKFQPCKDFCKVQEIVKQCFSIFGNKRRVF